jgi:hypothetical protein
MEDVYMGKRVVEVVEQWVRHTVLCVELKLRIVKRFGLFI